MHELIGIVHMRSTKTKWNWEWDEVHAKVSLVHTYVVQIVYEERDPKIKGPVKLIL